MYALEKERGLTPPPFRVASWSAKPSAQGAVVWLTRCVDASGQLVTPDAGAVPAAAALQAWDARVAGTASCSFLARWPDEPHRLSVVTRPLRMADDPRAALPLLPLAAMQPLSGQHNFVSFCTVDGAACANYTSHSLELAAATLPNTPKHGFVRTFASLEVVAGEHSPCVGAAGYVELRPNVAIHTGARWPSLQAVVQPAAWNRTDERLLLRPLNGEWGAANATDLCFAVVPAA
jgi:hypothetical protein